MKAVGIKVLPVSGAMTCGRAVLRLVGFLLAALPLGIGILSLDSDPNKQAWHDKIADTYVVKV
jgi:uncharacterized RDD family membrane protein YckC